VPKIVFLLNPKRIRVPAIADKFNYSSVYLLLYQCGFIGLKAWACVANETSVCLLFTRLHKVVVIVTAIFFIVDDQKDIAVLSNDDDQKDIAVLSNELTGKHITCNNLML